MTDVRTLLQKERDARRIQHPHLSYTKSGLLTCDVCHLNIKSEALWDGHLRSANHRKNLQKAKDEEDNGPRGTKRKIDDSREVASPRIGDREGRKKNKSVQFREETELLGEKGTEEILDGFVPAQDEEESIAQRARSTTEQVGQINDTSIAMPPAQEAPEVNEDEWAAFEREVAPLTQPNPVADYSSTTISAAPMTAAEIAAQAEAEKRTKRETEAEDEIEEEQRRMEEEFDFMEEMEERIKRLKEKREALRKVIPAEIEGREQDGAVAPQSTQEQRAEKKEEKVALVRQEKEEEEEDDDDRIDEVDDWFS